LLKTNIPVEHRKRGKPLLLNTNNMSTRVIS
jgi:hypothetical protein